MRQGPRDSVTAYGRAGPANGARSSAARGGSSSCSPSGRGQAAAWGPNAIRYTRIRYNEVVRDTNDQQLLLNIVRLRYADSPVFIDLPIITSQFELAAGGSDPGAGRQPDRTSASAGLTGRDTPTLSYHPREGREIAKAMLTPLSADLFSVVNAGANIEQLLLLTINDINDVPNAPRATTLTPQGPGRQRRVPPGHPDAGVAPRSRGHRAGDRHQRGVR